MWVRGRNSGGNVFLGSDSGGSVWKYKFFSLLVNGSG